MRGSGKFSVLFYEEKNLPRYLQIGPRPLRFFIFGLPIITMLAVAFALGAAYFVYQSKHATVGEENRTIRRLKQEIQQLSKAQQQAAHEITALQEKLSTEGSGGELTSSTLIHPAKGQQDLTAQKLITLENIKVVTEDRGVRIDFVMAKNEHYEQTLSGHIIIVLQKGNALSFYPANILNKQMQINYNSGETFSFGRLRPVNAVFAVSPESAALRFKIFIFSRNGDLLLEQIYTPSTNN